MLGDTASLAVQKDNYYGIVFCTVQDIKSILGSREHSGSNMASFIGLFSAPSQIRIRPTHPIGAICPTAAKHISPARYTWLCPRARRD